MSEENKPTGNPSKCYLCLQEMNLQAIPAKAIYGMSAGQFQQRLYMSAGDKHTGNPSKGYLCLQEIMLQPNLCLGQVSLQPNQTNDICLSKTNQSKGTYSCMMEINRTITIISQITNISRFHLKNWRNYCNHTVYLHLILIFHNTFIREIEEIQLSNCHHPLVLHNYIQII